MLSPRGGQIWLTGRSFIWPPLRQNSATWTPFDDDDKDRDDDEVEEESVITEKENIEVQMWSGMDWLILMLYSWQNSQKESESEPLAFTSFVKISEVTKLLISAVHGPLAE